MHNKLKNLGFTKINLGTVCLDSYSSSCDTTVHRYENENIFVSFGLMGKLHMEITMGLNKIDYRSPMKEFSEEELKELICKIEKGEKVMDLNHEDFI